MGGEEEKARAKERDRGREREREGEKEREHKRATQARGILSGAVTVFKPESHGLASQTFLHDTA